MIKLYTDKEYSNMAIQANEQHKKLIKVQEEREFSKEVYEYNKKTISVPIYNEDGEVIGYDNIEVGDLDSPIMVEVVDPVTGETVLVHAHHTEYYTDTVEYLEIVDNPENRIRELKAELKEIDLKSIRSIRDGDEEYILRYQQEAETIREEIREGKDNWE